MHIDTNKLNNYKTNTRTYFKVKRDIVEKYKITNIREGDDDFEGVSLYDICDALRDDYNKRRANYDAYIEKGMDARILMELRKSAILPMHPELYDFYDKHKNCKTVADIKKLRSDYLKIVHEDYEDLDWQYNILAITFLRSKAKDLRFNYEYCYKDANMANYTNPEVYTRDFIYAHTGIWYDVDTHAIYR